MEKNSREYYIQDEVVESYETSRYVSFQGMLRNQLQQCLLLEFLNDVSSPILEVGAGTGRFTRNLQERKFDLVAVDPSLKMISHNRKRMKVLGYQTPFVLGVGEQLPFANDSFGAAICIDVFSHIPEPLKIIQEMARVVRPNGYVVFNFTNLHSIMGLLINYVTNPLRRRFNRLEVYSTYHNPRPILNSLSSLKLRLIRRTGLFFIYPKMYPEILLRWLLNHVKFFEWRLTKTDSLHLFEQVFIKAQKEILANDEE